MVDAALLPALRALRTACCRAAHHNLYSRGTALAGLRNTCRYAACYYLAPFTQYSPSRFTTTTACHSITYHLSPPATVPPDGLIYDSHLTPTDASSIPRRPHAASFHTCLRALCSLPFDPAVVVLPFSPRCRRPQRIPCSLRACLHAAQRARLRRRSVSGSRCLGKRGKQTWRRRNGATIA